MKIFKLDKFLKESGWNKNEITCIKVKGEVFKLGDKGFSNRLNYLNSGKVKIAGILVGYAISKFGMFSNSVEIWCKNNIYMIHRKVA